MRKFVATLFAGALLSVGAVAPASAQQQGLVNVEIRNLLNNNTVQVAIPINAAANICGVSVVVLAQELASGPVTCEARSGRQELTITA